MTSLVPCPVLAEQFVTERRKAKEAQNKLLSIFLFVASFFYESSNMSFPELPRTQQEL